MWQKTFYERKTEIALHGQHWKHCCHLIPSVSEMDTATAHNLRKISE
jgi:hypothetical protein